MKIRKFGEDVIFWGGLLVFTFFVIPGFSQTKATKGKTTAKADTTVARISVTATATASGSDTASKKSASSPSSTAASSGPFKVFKVDLNTPVVNDYLPFDVPFLFTTTVPTKVTQARCNVYVIGDKVPCDLAQYSKSECQNPCLDPRCTVTSSWGQVKLCDSCCFKKILLASAQGMIARPSKKDTVQSVSFFIQGLPANVDVYVEFVTYTPVSKKEFESVLQAVVRGGSPATPEEMKNALKEKISKFPGNCLDAASAELMTESVGLKFVDLANTIKNKNADTENNSAAFTKAITGIRMYEALLTYIEKQAVTSKNDAVAAIISKINSSVDSDWKWIFEGYTALTSDKSPLPLAPVKSVSFEKLSADSLDKHLTRIGVSTSSLKQVQAYLQTVDVDKDPVLKAKEKDFQDLRANLSNAVLYFDIPRNKIADILGSIDEFSSAMSKIISSKSPTSGATPSVFNLPATTSNSFAVRGSWYLAADVGICYAGQLKDAFLYYGTNIYLSPVDKDAMYSLKNVRRIYRDHPVWKWVGKHSSFTIGVTASSVANTSKRTVDLFSGHSLILGGGVRLGSAFKLSAGELLFKGYAPNPLSNTQQLKSSWFIGASVDADLLKFFGKVGNLLFPN